MPEHNPALRVPPSALPPPHPGFVDFARAQVGPAAALYIGRDDRLLIRARSSVGAPTVNVWLRLGTPSGTVMPLVYRLVPGADRSVNSQVFDLAEGFLLSAVAFVTDAVVRRGELYVEAYLIRGAAADLQVPALLIAGYITTTSGRSWPNGLIESSLDGQGALSQLTGADPAAGAEVSQAVPTDARWLLSALRFQLVTSAAVATRRVHLIIDDGTTIQLDIAAQDTQAASLTRNYNAAAFGYQPTAQVSEIYLPIPPNLYMFQGWRVRTITDSIQAADDFGAPQLSRQEWLED